MRSYLAEAEKALMERLRADGKLAQASASAQEGLTQGENAAPEIAFLYAEYDLEPWFESFMAFKEDSFGNREVPYVRYYREGVFSGESNYLSADGFTTRLT
jgi:hypothetical protein